MADINLGVGGANSATGGYEIDNSCKFEADNVEKMTHTYDSAPTSQKKGTISMWFKRTEIGSNIGLFQFGDDASGNYLSLRWGRDIYGSLETYGMRLGGTNFSVGNSYGAIRDTSAWYHVVIAIDTTQATSTNRFKVYRNGVEPGWSTDNTSNITQNADLAIGENGKDIMIGEGVYRYNGYIAEVHYVDGQQLTSADFGEYDDDSGIWKPKAYTGTYGNNGFYLDFSNASNLGEDQSGNNHDFTLNNITSANQATDTPTNNFAIPNVIGNTRANAFTYVEGATRISHQGGNDWNSWANTIAVGSGKWYAEFKIIGAGNHFVGVGSEDYYFIGAGNGTGFPEIYYGYSGTNSVGLYSANGNIYNNGTIVVIGTTFTNNDIISVALDTDNGKVYFAKNGTYINSQNPVTGTNAQNLPDTEARYFIGTSEYGSNIGADCNFGGYTAGTISSAATDANGYGTFEYAPPSGYYALCTKNLAEYG